MKIEAIANVIASISKEKYKIVLFFRNGSYMSYTNFYPFGGGGGLSKSGDPVESAAITNRRSVLPFFDKVRTRRGFVWLMADSNHNFASHGWQLGLGIPLLRRYGCWGVGIPNGANGPVADATGGGTSGAITTYPTGPYRMGVVASTNLVSVAADRATGTEFWIRDVSTDCGLTIGTIYYWNRQSGTTGYFYDTFANAIAGGATGRVDITADADIAARQVWMGNTADAVLSSGAASLLSFTPSTTDQVNNVLTFPGIHGFAAANEVHVSETGGGLIAGTSYYVKLGDESDANTTFECRLYTDIGLTSIVDLTSDITAKISRILPADGSTRPGYIGLSGAPHAFLQTGDNLKATWFFRKHEAGEVPGSFTPSMRHGSPFTTIDGSAQTTVATGTDEWTAATHTVQHSWPIGAVASSTQLTINGHTLNTQDPVVFRVGGTASSSVLQGITYYVRRIDTNTVQLHSTAANANSNTSPLTVTGLAGTLDRRWLSSEWFVSKFANVKLKGKALFTGRYVENPSVTNGLAMHSYFGVGGATSTTMLWQLKADVDVLPRYLTELREITSNGPLMIWIQVGGNDRSGSMATALFKSNVQGIINTWKTAWEAAGGAVGDLYFVLHFNHPQQSVAESLNKPYHTVFKELTAENARCACIIMSEGIATGDEMFMQGATTWFDSGGDSHLTAAGYTELGNRIINALCG